MGLSENFLQPALSDDFYWLNEPTHYRLGNGLEISTDEKTDFWQNTHYGFQRDDGHCLLMRQVGDFSLMTQVEFQPREKYDQCGLMVRIDSQNWIKVSTEYESEQASRLGSVVTNLGYSDWATQDISSRYREMWYRISKRGSDFLLENSTLTQDSRRLPNRSVCLQPDRQSVSLLFQNLGNLRQSVAGNTRSQLITVCTRLALMRLNAWLVVVHGLSVLC